MVKNLECFGELPQTKKAYEKFRRGHLERAGGIFGEGDKI